MREVHLRLPHIAGEAVASSARVCGRVARSRRHRLRGGWRSSRAAATSGGPRQSGARVAERRDIRISTRPRRPGNRVSHESRRDSRRERAGRPGAARGVRSRVTEADTQCECNVSRE